MVAIDIGTAPWAENNPGRVILARPVWVHYGHVDLEQMHKYYQEFGLKQAGRASNPERIFYKGYNDQPVVLISEKTDRPMFFGGSMEAATPEDLHRAAALPGAGHIRDSDLPGGGKVITITDPDGIPFNIVHGYATIPRGEPPKGADVFNKPEASDDTKPRRGRFQRVPLGPAPVHKLGHFGHVTKAMFDVPMWYMRNFNLKIADVQANPMDKSKDFAIFYHLDLGQRFSDHHAFFHFAMFPNQQYPGPHHAAFEIHDMDVQLQGHQHLHKQGYNLMWGVGRHLLGSQIFDYWYDHDGFVIEHYSDGDVLNEDNKPVRHELNMEEYTAWSANGGIRFLKGKTDQDLRPNMVATTAAIAQSG